jgi:hypothetical protein
MTNLHNLDTYEQYQQYYDLYTKHNIKLHDIVKNIIQTYKFEYDPKKYYRYDTVNIITRNIYELSGIIIMLNAIIEKTFYGFCIKTGNKYQCEKMYCNNNNTTKFFEYAYHFNCSGDEFIIKFGWEYFTPILIYYPKSEEVYNISYRYSNITDYVNNIDYSIYYYPKHKYTSYIIGLMPNAGHYFWQEIYGLMLLIEYNLIDNIDEFIIYKYDYLNIANILKTKFNKKIIYLTSDRENHSLTVNISKHYITNSSIEIFKNTYGLTNIIQNNQKEFNILFDLRSNNRIWLNQIPIIINIMNGLKQHFGEYSFNFFISGFYRYQQNISTEVYNQTKEIERQVNMFNCLQSKVTFRIFNLINVNLSEIVKICQKIDLCVANLGSGLSFYYSTIFNKPTIGVTTATNCIGFNEQRYAFENKINNTSLIPHSYITDINDNFNLQYGILYDYVVARITEIISNKAILNK